MRVKVSSVKRSVSWLGWGVLFLVLFHFESLFLGPIKISHLWKGVLLVLLVIAVRPKHSIYSPLILLSLLSLFSLELFVNPLSAIIVFLTTIIIPLIGIYSLKKEGGKTKEALAFFSIFFILSFVPYELGLLAPLGKAYDLTGAYDFSVQGAIGPFQTVHSASTALAGSLLVILYFLLVATRGRAVLCLLLIVGFYLLFSTYVRTGMAMFAVGSAVMLGYFSIKSRRMAIRAALLLIVALPTFSFWVLSNDALVARIAGERAYSSEFGSFETLGSGRGALAVATLDIFVEASITEKLVGMGVTEQKMRMAERMGAELIPHNGFLAILTHHGLFGLALFLWFIASFWAAAGRLSTPLDRGFVRSLLAAYIVMTFFQQFDMMYMVVLMMLAYSWKLNVLRIDRCPRRCSSQSVLGLG